MASSLNKRDHCDIAIIGGGLAGGLSAIHLARAGFKVVLFEKEKREKSGAKSGHKVCGEFLGGEALPLLREVGINPIALGASPIAHFRLHGPTQTSISKLPRRGVGISRAVLDEELLRLAAEAGCEIRRGVCVNEILEGLDETTGSILLSTSTGETRASRLIVATGQTEFASINERIGRDGSYVAFRIHLRLKPSCFSKLRGHCDLFSFEHGYGTLTDIGDGIAAFSLVVDRAFVRSIGTDWDSLSSHIGKTNWSASHYLDGAKPLSKSFATTGTLPYGFLRRIPAPAGLFFVGDQMAVFPSLASDGMTVALMTARRAVDAMIERLPGGEARLRFAPVASREYQRAARRALRPQMEAALAIHTLFKNPKLIDFATYAISAVPALFQSVFRTTRCHFIEISPKPRLRSWPKHSAQPEIASAR